MTTIGYGDYYPRTIPGRMVTFILSIWGIVMVSLSVVALSGFVLSKQREKLSFHVMKEVNTSDELRKKSVKLVKSVYEAAKAYKMPQGFFKKFTMSQKLRQFRASMGEFKKVKKEKQRLGVQKDICDVIILENDYLKYDCRLVKENQLGILEGANKLLDKIVSLRSKEVGRPSTQGFMLKLNRVKTYEEDVVNDDFWDFGDRDATGDLEKPDSNRLKKGTTLKRARARVNEVSKMANVVKKLKVGSKGRNKVHPFLRKTGEKKMTKTHLRKNMKTNRKKDRSSKKGFKKI